MDLYKYLEKEQKTRNNLKKKYTRLSNICLGTELFIIVSELGITGTSIALPVIMPVSAPVVVALSTCSTILKSIGRLITKKTSKHSKIEMLAKSKLNSIEEKFNKVINDGEIMAEEFNDIQQEIKNYESMKLSIQNEHKFKGLYKNKRND
jgi:CRISPR/Cas system CMR subunit Cmr4 (Cas7 group RAMP superfamily)